MKSVYERAKEFKKKYKMTISWRLRAHSKILQRHLNPDEEMHYVFAAQKNNSTFNIFTTALVAITNKRIMIAQKRLLFGYFFTSITPDLFNDLKVNMGIIWGKVYIDTAKEFISFSNIQSSALPEIETSVTEYVMREKIKYGSLNKED